MERAEGQQVRNCPLRHSTMPSTKRDLGLSKVFHSTTGDCGFLVADLFLRSPTVRENAML
jgi:hypothetical protein